MATAAPPPDMPSYGEAVLVHVRAVAPEQFERLPVRFYSTYVSSVPGTDPANGPALAALVNLEVWGFPTSLPAFDPGNHAFVYQRFQRGILHYDHTTGTTGAILLADWLKSLLTGHLLPPDLAAQAAGSRLLRQYCPNRPRSLCRPQELPHTDMTLAFEPVF